ncbi:MAG: hypothetical protein IJS71_08490 [Clostridia bacterium]|nr:hypothetical protein [Clostridia bacterium]
MSDRAAEFDDVENSEEYESWELPQGLINVITEEVMKQASSVIDRAVRTASLAAIEQYKKEREARIFRIKDKRYQNTRLLLKKWRELEDYYHNTIFDEAGVAKGYGADLMMMVGARFEQRIVNSVRDKVVFTSVVMQNFECAFELYRAYCEMSGKEEIKRRWRVIYKVYLDLNKVMSPEEVAAEEGVSVSQCYSDIKKAVEDLDKRLFGLDPEYFDFE